MSCARKDLYEKISVLLKQEKREDGVVCVVLFEKWRELQTCPTCVSLPNESRLLTKLMKKTRPDLIAQMISVNANAGIRGAALSFLIMVWSSLSDAVHDWSAAALESLLPAIIECALVGPEERSRYQAQLLLRSFPAHAQEFTPLRLVEAVIGHPSLPTLSNPSEILSLVNDLFSLPSSSKFTLSDQLAHRLQSMVVSSLHGLAGEGVRDRTLSICTELLAERTTLNPSWTVARLPSAPSFPCFLCSILAGEFKLSLEELLHCLQHEALDTHVAQRLNRSMQAVSTCAELLQAFLLLLVGGDDAENAPWSALDAESVGAIRKHIQSCFSDCTDFLEETVSLLRERQSKSTLVDADNSLLTSLPVVDKVLKVVVELADADEELRGTIVSKLSKVLLILSLIGDAGSADVCFCNMSVQLLSSLQVWVQASDNTASIADELLTTFQPVADGIIRCVSAIRRGKSCAPTEQSDTTFYSDAVVLFSQHVLFLLRLHNRSLKSLIAGEGLHALESLFHCKITVIKELHNSLADISEGKNVAAIDDSVHTLVTQLRSFNMHVL